MKWLGKVVAAVLVLILAAAGSIFALFDANQIRPLLESKLSDALGRPVKIGDLKLELLAGNIAASDISVGEDPAFGNQPFLVTKSLKTSVELRPLIFDHQVRIKGVVIDQPQLRLILSSNGLWNFSTLGKTASSPSQDGGDSSGVSLETVKIANGKFTLVRPGVPDHIFDDIDLELQHPSASTAIPFHLSARRSGGGTLETDGVVGPMTGSSALPPLDAKFKMAAIDVNEAGLVDKSTGVGGVAGFSGAIKTSGNALNLTGDLRAEKLKLVPEGKLVSQPVDVAFTVSHDTTRGTGRLSRADMRVGKALVTLSGTYSLSGAKPGFSMKIDGKKVALTELAALLPALNIVLPAASKLEAGTLTMQSTVSGTTGYFSSIGTISLENVKLANFDLGKEMKVVAMLAGLPQTPTTEIPSASATVKHTPEGTLVEALALEATNIGTLSGTGTIGAANELDFQMNAVLKTKGAVMANIGLNGDTRVPFLIQGTTEKPIFKPDLKKLTTEKIQQLTKDPVKTFSKAKEMIQGGDVKSLFGLFGGKKTEPAK